MRKGWHRESESPLPGEPSMGKTLLALQSRAWWIALTYALFATLWIYFSDQVLATVFPDPNQAIPWSLYKGLGFVLVTAVLLLLLMRWAFGTTENAYLLLKAREKQLRASQGQLSAIISTAMDAIITVNHERRIVLFNTAAEKMFHCSASEALTLPIERFIPEKFDPTGENSLIIRGLRHDDCEFPLEASISRIETGHQKYLTVILRDISPRLAHEAEIERLTRLYYALSQINQAIVWQKNRGDLLQKICQVLVHQGGFRLAWIGWHEPESKRLQPVAECGDENNYLRSIRIYTDDRPEGRGPSGVAFRENRSYICNRLMQDPATVPWRSEILRRGFQALAVFPIAMQSKPCATLSVYSDLLDFFQDKEIDLLQEAAMDISFALENLERVEEHREAEKKVLTEKLFSDTMIESMPGILYFSTNKEGFYVGTRISKPSPATPRMKSRRCIP